MVVVIFGAIIIALLIVIIALIAYASGVAYDLQETKAKIEKLEHIVSQSNK